MLNNSFNVLIRNLKRNWLSSLINLLGLTIAFTCCLLVFSYIKNESSYDRWYPEHDRLYRIAAKINMGGIDFSSAMAAPPLAKTMVHEIPEVEKATRLWLWPNISVKNDQHPDGVIAFNEKGVLEADSNFFDVFQFELIEGDTHTALKNPNSIVITRETAIKYFGKEAYLNGEIVGKSLSLKIWGRYRPYQVYGICKEPKEQTHFNFDILFSINGDPDCNTSHWLNNTFYTYALLSQNASITSVEEKLGHLVDKYINAGYNKEFSPVEKSGSDYWHLILQPVTSIHLHSDFESELSPNGNIRNLYIALGTVLLVWIIAFLNYINLFTVNNFKRAKEIAIRKISGAGKKNIFSVFTGESIGFVSLAMCLAIVACMVSYRWLEPISPGIKSLDFSVLPIFGLAILILIFITGFAGGAYSATKLTLVNNMILIKNAVFNYKGKNRFRQTIVTTQFVIAIILIAVSIMVSQQLDFLMKKNPGYDQEHVLIMDAPVWGLRRNFDDFKSKLADCPSVVSATTSHTVPGDGDYNTPLYLKISGDQSHHLVIPYRCSYDFIETLGFNLKDGRDFEKNYNDQHSIILSESAVKELGLKNPIGSSVFESEIRANNEQLTKLDVVGVVKDVHFESYYKGIRPFALLFDQFHNYLSVRVRSGEIPMAISSIEKLWKESYPDAPFKYSFLDKKFDAQYQREANLKQFLSIFSAMAISLSVIGLFAMALSIANQRTKEIGIRKVNGASIFEILVMLNKDFVKWVAISFVVATPLAWYAMYNWLNNFAYKTIMSWWIFALSGLLALGVALLTVSFQSWKAATRNPVEALRYE